MWWIIFFIIIFIIFSLIRVVIRNDSFYKVVHKSTGQTHKYGKYKDCSIWIKHASDIGYNPSDFKIVKD